MIDIKGYRPYMDMKVLGLLEGFVCGHSRHYFSRVLDSPPPTTLSVQCPRHDDTQADKTKHSTVE